MELDEIDPAKWAELEAATRDYILTVAHKFDAAAEALAQVRCRACSASLRERRVGSMRVS